MPWWNGVLFATTQKPVCIQSDPFVFRIPLAGDEDCLYLNIYRPTNPRPGRPLSVLIFLHGGGWFLGGNEAASYGPQYFMETGEVLLVTVAYRLSAFGFLATGDAASPGNYGLKDQALAMHWVRQNIAKFGGDPHSVTLMGQSAGAASVQLHMISSLSEGLFDASIAASATALTPWAFVHPDPMQQAINLAEVTGIPNARLMSSHELIEELRKVSAEVLVTNVNRLKRWGQHRTIEFRPVVEPPIEGAFLLEDPRDLIARGQIHRVPHMASFAETEGINFGIYNATNMQQFNERIHELMPFILELDRPPGNLMTEQIRQRYLPERGIITPFNDENWLQALSDRFYLHPLYRMNQFLAGGADAAPLFLYKFDYRGQHSYSATFTGSKRDYGAVHLDDMIYLFDMPLYFPTGLNERDQQAKEVLMGHYVRFITGHDPGFAPCESVGFEPIHCPYMRFDDHNVTGLITSQMTDLWDMDMVRFWDQASDIPIYTGSR